MFWSPRRRQNVVDIPRSYEVVTVLTCPVGYCSTSSRPNFMMTWISGSEPADSPRYISEHGSDETPSCPHLKSKFRLRSVPMHELPSFGRRFFLHIRSYSNGNKIMSPSNVRSSNNVVSPSNVSSPNKATSKTSRYQLLTSSNNVASSGNG